MANKSKGFSLPHPGQRIIKTTTAVFLCLLVYYLRGYGGMITESVITSIVLIQPYRRSTKSSAITRVEGTLLGAGWGLLHLYLFEAIPIIPDNRILMYAMMAFGTGLCLYTAVAAKLSDAASLSAIVFLCIVVYYPNVETPILQTLNRIMDLTIGIVIATIVNTFHLPRIKHPEKVFFVRLQDLVEDRFSHVSPRIFVDLNRLYDDGARICLESKWAPAFLMSQMGLLKNINMPAIVMDGAALYDITENAFLDIIDIEHKRALQLTTFLEGEGLGYLVFAMRNNVMHTFRLGTMNEAEEEEYRMMRRSPYRNYVDGLFHEEDQVAVIRVLIPNMQADAFERRIRLAGLKGLFRVDRRPQPRLEGWTGFYFSNPEATIENMERHVINRQENFDKIVPQKILPLSQYYDPDTDAPFLLKRLRAEYMPLYLFRK